MYTLTFGQHTIYDPRVEAYSVREPLVQLAVGAPGFIDFTIDNDHPAAAHLTKLKGVLELAEDGVPIFRGRIIKDVTAFDLSREIEAEGAMAYLNDSVIAPFNFPDDFANDNGYTTAADSGNVVQYFLSWLIGQHNAQVTAEQQIQLGTVTVSDANNYIIRSASEYSSTLEVIQDKLVGSSLGGYLLMRYEADGNYLDYVDALPLTNTQQVEFAENLLDLVTELDATEIYTVILPVGADGLTIESLADGDIGSDLVKNGALIYSRAGVAAYGRITRAVTWDDVTLPENLRTKAAAALGAAGFAQTITVRACDLHYADGQTASFRVGRNVRLVSTPHGFSAVYPLMELSVDILDPGSTEITLGRMAITQTDSSNRIRAELAEQADAQVLALNSLAATINSSITTVAEQLTTTIQNNQEIILQALESYVETGDLETYKQQISTQFTQTAVQIELSFFTIQEQINDVNGDLQAKYTEQLRYIRFIDGNIVLGEEGNALTLRIENDRISFLESGAEVAYVSDRRLYITDGEFINSLKLGKFAFLPRANGNLSFKKVEG